MNKTLIALLTAASFLTIGAAQATDKPMDKPMAEAATHADAGAKPAKHVNKIKHSKKDKKAAEAAK